MRNGSASLDDDSADEAVAPFLLWSTSPRRRGPLNRFGEFAGVYSAGRWPRRLAKRGGLGSYPFDERGSLPGAMVSCALI